MSLRGRTTAEASELMEDHTFVVPAYGQSRYLEDCLASLGRQSVHSRIVLSTSTPFDGIEQVAARHGADLFVHGPNGGIGRDWNAALGQSRSEWTTIAHQDDLYHPEYARAMIAAGKAAAPALIVFSDYAERWADGKRADVALVRAKRRLLEAGFLGRRAIFSVAAKRRTLRFGNAISCPAVTYHRRALRDFSFREDLKICLDWAAWLELAGRPGAFVWVRDALMEHRIHGASETAAGFGNGVRWREDLEMLSTLWPRPLARLIVAGYRWAYAQGHTDAAGAT